jgi:MFS family permease
MVSAQPAIQNDADPPAAAPDIPPWRDHDFVRLWIAQATGLLGKQFSILAVPLVAIFTLHSSATTVALLKTAFNLPWLIFGLFAGVVVDRFSRRGVLIISDIARALLLGSVPAVAALGWLTIGQLFVLALVVGAFDVCWRTAYRSYVPTVVAPAHLDQAYSATGASDGVTKTAGPSIAGALIQLLGPPAGLAVTGATYLTSALSNSTIHRRETAHRHRRHDPIVQSFRDGLTYSWRQHTVRALAVSDGLYMFFWAATQSVILVFLTRELGLSAGVIGAVYSVGTIGGILAAFLARRVGLRVGTGRSIVSGSLLRSAGTALLPIAIIAGPLAIPVVIVTRFINAFGWTLWDVHQETTTQRLLCDTFRGRANGSVQFVSGGAFALGSGTGAGLVALTNVDLTLIVCAIATLAATCWLVATGIWSLINSSAPFPNCVLGSHCCVIK